MNFGKKYLVWALGYAIVGMAIGVYMGGSGNFSQVGAHSHILLVGFVVSFIYGVIHRLWLVQTGRGIAQVQFYVHQASSLVMLAGLVLMVNGALPMAVLGPVIGIASVGVLVGVIVMTYMVFRAGSETA